MKKFMIAAFIFVCTLILHFDSLHALTSQNDLGATSPNIPPSFDLYGFLHLGYDASHNDLKDFTSYTNTGFASSPDQVPLLVTAGFKHIVYVMNHFSPGYSPLLEKFVQDEGIQLNGVTAQNYDYRNIPHYNAKMLALYREQLVDLKNQLTANGTIDKITLFYLADEPALHRNYIPDQDFLNGIDQTFKGVFPGKKTIMTFAEDRSGAHPFGGPHMDPPPTLDAIGMDPYFQDGTTVSCSEDSVRNFLYNTHPNSAISWAEQWGKPVYLIGDAMLRDGKAFPYCYATDTFNIVKSDPKIKGLVWYIYDAGNLDGGTYLSGAAGDPEFIKRIRSLTESATSPSIAALPATPPVAVSNARAQCLEIGDDLAYGDTDFDYGKMTNGNVRRLQEYLHARGLLKMNPNGRFGKTTALAVRSFQYLDGIPRTGYVGSVTRAALARATGCTTSVQPDTTPSSPSPVVSSQDTGGAPVINTTPDRVAPYGGKAVIAWNVTPSTSVSCKVAGSGLTSGSSVGTTGTWVTPTLRTTAVYTIECTNTRTGLTSKHSVTVAVLPQRATDPTATFTQSKSSTVVNEVFYVNWSSSNALSCTFESNTYGAGWALEGEGLTGSKAFRVATAGSYEGRLTCQGVNGTTPFVSVLHHTITPATNSAATPSPANSDWCASLDASQYCTTQSCTTTTGIVRYGTKVCASSSAVLGATTECYNLPFNMHRGYESAAVSNLQNFLKSSGFLDEVSGFYGDKTVAAVKKYQLSRGLPQTGMVYDATRAAIKAVSCQ